MDWQVAIASFVSVFFSELGDKSQLATMSLSSNSRAPHFIFLGAALALLLTSLLGVLLGDGLAAIVPTRALKAAAAGMFALLAFRLLAAPAAREEE